MNANYNRGTYREEKRKQTFQKEAGTKKTKLIHSSDTSRWIDDEAGLKKILIIVLFSCLVYESCGVICDCIFFFKKRRLVDQVTFCKFRICSRLLPTTTVQSARASVQDLSTSSPCPWTM